jgi:hypothetical protein
MQSGCASRVVVTGSTNCTDTTATAFYTLESRFIWVIRIFVNNLHKDDNNDYHNTLTTIMQ